MVMIARMRQLLVSSLWAKKLTHYLVGTWPELPVTQERRRCFPPSVVLIVENETLLGAGIENLLRDAAAVEVHGIQPDSANRLLEAIRQLKPDTVILDKQSTLLNALQLLDFFDGDYPEQIIEMNPQTELVQIYQRHWVAIKQIAELAVIITHQT